MDKRFLLALGLCAGIMIIWFQFVMPIISPPRPKPEVPPSASESDQEKGAGETKTKNDQRADSGTSAAGTGKNAEKPPEAVPGAAEGRTALTEARTVEVSAPEFVAAISSRGAVLESLTLRNFMDPFAFPEESKPFKILREIEKDRFACALRLESDKGRLDREIWEIERQEPGLASFLFRVGGGLWIRKTFSAHVTPETSAGSFILEIAVETGLDKSAAEPSSVVYSLSGPAGISPEFETQGRMLHAFAAFGIDPLSPTVKNFTPSNAFDSENRRVPVRNTTIHWLGVANKYFGSVLIAPNPADLDYGIIEPILDTAAFDALPPNMSLDDRIEKASSNVCPTLFSKRAEIKPGESVRHSFLLFTGPKEKKFLTAPGFDISGVGDVSYIFCIPQAVVAWLATLILAILKMFYAIFGNYGLAIIFMTILVKLILLPVSIKQQMSMSEYQRKMKKVQPMIKAAKEKYKNDRQKQSQETMKIMKEHGVSVFPFKGCLPVLLQFPIFIALFYTLRYSIELRQKGFLYMEDLARPDRLFKLPDFVPQIPLVGGFIGTHFNVLPILWIAVMIVSQKYSPMKSAMSDDPQLAQQQKMMTVMMVIFGVMFFSMESGCVLYIIVSTLIGMGEQFIIRRRIAAAEQ